jgi:hypothetical protein
MFKPEEPVGSLAIADLITQKTIAATRKKRIVPS